MKPSCFLLWVMTVGATGPVCASPPRVIYSNIPGHPTAVCPGSAGDDFASFSSIHFSFDGDWWILKATAGITFEDVVVYGFGTDGANGVLAAREGAPSGLGDGTLHGALDTDCAINNHGDYCFGSRLVGAPTSSDKVILASNGLGDLVVAHREHDPAPALTDNGTIGDEVLGDILSIGNRLNDGTILFKAEELGNAHEDFDDAVYLGSTPLAQSGTTTTTGQEYLGFYNALSGANLAASADGSSWIAEGWLDLSAPDKTEGVVVNGAVQIKDGDPLGAGEVLYIQHVAMSGNGSWTAKGEYSDGRHWIAIQPTGGALTLIESNDPVTPGSSEVWNALSPAVINSDGNYALAGSTFTPGGGSSSNYVLVLNGETILAQAGDPIDLDGDGLPDGNAVLSGIARNTLAFTSDGNIIGLAAIFGVTPGPFPVNAAILVIDIPDDPCFADCDGSGSLNVDDIDCFVMGFLGADLLTADCDGNGTLNVDDIDCFIAAFLGGCG